VLFLFRATGRPEEGKPTEVHIYIKMITYENPPIAYD
jgi:hypothetical protein